MEAKMSFNTRQLVTALVALGMAAFATSAGAQTITDQANDAKLNLPGSPGFNGSLPVGLYDMERNVPSGGPATVDQVDDMVQAWYWYRIGNTAEAQLGDGAAGGSYVGSFTANHNFNAGDDRLRAVYSDGNLSFTVTYDLTGFNYGSFKTQLTRTVQVKNVSSVAQNNIALFSFTEMDQTRVVGGAGTGFDPGLETATLLSPTYIRQTDNSTQGFGVLSDSSNIATTPTKTFIGKASTILGLLGDGSASALPTGTTATSASTADADRIGFVNEWDFNLAPGQTYTISESTVVVPEPASLALLGLGTALVGAPIRRRRA